MGYGTVRDTPLSLLVSAVYIAHTTKGYILNLGLSKVILSFEKFGRIYGSQESNHRDKSKSVLIVCSCSLSIADSLDSLSMDNFWLEVENIKQSTEAEQEECNLADVKTPEEGEAEAEWLQDAGLSDLIGDHTSDNGNIVLLSTLTKTQAAAVQRRLDTYSRSRRKKNKPPVRDVRDIFGGANSEVCCFTDFQNVSMYHSEEIFSTDIAYSEQAAILLKGSFLQESRRIKDKSTLTKFKIPKGRLGVTRIGDLSPQDMKKVPTLALIELTALCDILGLELKRNKAAKQKGKENHLFGVPLSTLLENDQKLIPNTKVPLILQAVSHLQISLAHDNILNSFLLLALNHNMKSLEQKLESDFYTGLFHWEEVRQNDVSGLLKRFIRELPTPLLTAEYLPAFAAVQNIPDLKQRLQALNLLILILPEPNRNTLKALLEFLSKVVAREKKNKMNLWNVSTVIAPNLFMHKGLPNKIPEGKEKQLAEGAADVVRMMIHYQDLLWTVSHMAVCWMIATCALDRWGHDSEVGERTVKVQTSLVVKDSLEVHLNSGTKAADVLRQFQKHGAKYFFLKFVFYLTGEHCLDPDTYLLDLYQINPHAEWIIRQNPSFPRLL
uniref:Rho GTPase activating protein 40 n=1 Tax=Pelusios castaneus TaxID=367368 RepID=A0A8C8SGA8_9SAUR